VECQFSVEKVKGQGHQMSKTSRNCCISSVNVYLQVAVPSAPWTVSQFSVTDLWSPYVALATMSYVN